MRLSLLFSIINNARMWRIKGLISIIGELSEREKETREGPVLREGTRKVLFLPVLKKCNRYVRDQEGRRKQENYRSYNEKTKQKTNPSFKKWKKKHAHPA